MNYPILIKRLFKFNFFWKKYKFILFYLLIIFTSQNLYSESNLPYRYITLSEYIEKVLENNPASKINAQEYKLIQLDYLKELQKYSFNIDLSGSAEYNIEPEGRGAYIALDTRKILYDGGKKRILEKELEIIKTLSNTNLLAQNDTLILTAILYYTDFFYKQEVLDFLKEQFEQQKSFVEKIESSYQKGIKFSTYDYLTSKSELLKLEKDLVNQKSNIIKTEVAFRQFGHIFNPEPIKLYLLDINFKPDIITLQKYSLIHNNSLNTLRLEEELQKNKILEKEAEGGFQIYIRSSLGIQGGTNEYTDQTNLIASIAISFGLPIYDGGVRKTEILSERIKTIKQNLMVKKVEEDIIKKLNELYTDYKAIEQIIEILQQQLIINEKRLKVSLERLEKGLEDYRAVRESWTDLINTKIELIYNKTISQKILADMSVLSGIRIF
ncbi:MAG: TolC family protein [Candidatus Pacearchaeota archaeon]